MGEDQGPDLRREHLAAQASCRAGSRPPRGKEKVCDVLTITDARPAACPAGTRVVLPGAQRCSAKLVPLQHNCD